MKILILLIQGGHSGTSCISLDRAQCGWKGGGKGVKMRHLRGPKTRAFSITIALVGGTASDSASVAVSNSPVEDSKTGRWQQESLQSSIPCWQETFPQAGHLHQVT